MILPVYKWIDLALQAALSRCPDLESTVGKRTQFAYSLSTGATMQAKPSSRSFQLCYHRAEGKIDCVFLSLYR